MLAQDVKSIQPTLPVEDLERARKFYEEKLGFTPTNPTDYDVFYSVGGSSLYLYKRGRTKADHTEANFEVEDVEKEVEDLRSRGVQFEEYDMPEMNLKTVNGIATFDGMKAAWFKDPEGNILSIGSMS